jgi:putative PIG3 family NAD(P)H quinone oxidoreductase
VPAPQALPVPKGFDMVMAAAVPETIFTVWVNLFDGGRLVRGETVPVHGGSGGIGSAAIQVAHAFGARVFTTARTAEKCRACEAMGAERAINYREEDFVEVVLKATGGRGVDVVIDIIGGDYLVRNFKALATEGRLVQVALQGGANVEVPLFVLMRKRLTLTGSTLRPRPVAEKGRIATALREHVWPLFEAGKIKSLIYRMFPLVCAAEAHALMESRDNIGKIVLIP